MLEFPPMPRPPSAVDHIRRRLEAKEKIRKEKDAMTPFKDKVNMKKFGSMLICFTGFLNLLD